MSQFCFSSAKRNKTDPLVPVVINSQSLSFVSLNDTAFLNSLSEATKLS